MTARAILVALSLAAQGPALAQHAVLSERARFNQALQINDYAAVERLRAALVAAGTRDQSGVLVSDMHLNWADISVCRHDFHKLMPDQSGIKPLPPEECSRIQEARLQAWEKQFPASVLPAIGRSNVYSTIAMSLSPTTAASSAIREQFLNRAVQSLEAVAPAMRDSIWHIARMRIATLQGLGKKQFWPLFTQASTKFPDRAEIYRQAAIHFLPKHGGSLEEIEEVAQFAVTKSRKLQGLSMYAYVHDAVVWGEGRLGESGFFRSKHSWPMLRAGLGDIYQRHPTAWNHNRFALSACMIRDIPTLKALLRDKKSIEAEGWTRGQSEHCRKLVSAPQPVI